MQAFKNDLIEEYLKKILRVYSKITPVIPSDRIMSNFFFGGGVVLTLALSDFLMSLTKKMNK